MGSEWLRVAPQPRADLIHAAQEIRAGAVILLTNATREHRTCSSGATQSRIAAAPGHRANKPPRESSTRNERLYFNGEVDVSRVSMMLMRYSGKLFPFPSKSTWCCAGMVMPALLLLFHVIHDGRSVMPLADLCDTPV